MGSLTGDIKLISEIYETPGSPKHCKSEAWGAERIRVAMPVLGAGWLTFLDILFSLLFVGPFTVLYWRGILLLRYPGLPGDSQKSHAEETVIVSLLSKQPPGGVNIFQFICF